MNDRSRSLLLDHLSKQQIRDELNKSRFIACGGRTGYHYIIEGGIYVFCIETRTAYGIYPVILHLGHYDHTCIDDRKLAQKIVIEKMENIIFTMACKQPAPYQLVEKYV